MKTYLITSLERSNNNLRMHPTIKLIMLMSVFLLIFTVENVYSQDTLNCANFPCEENWEGPKTIAGNMGSGITGLITYRTRKCDSIEYIIVDDFHAYDNGLHLDTVRVFHFNYTAFSDLVDIYVLQREFNITSTPDSVNPPMIVAQVYKASCGVWVQCTYDIDSIYTKCDSGYTPPYPHYTQYQELPIFKWQPCGFVCCKKTYEINRYLSQINLPMIKIKSLNIERSPSDSTCTEQYKYTKPCESGC